MKADTPMDEHSSDNTTHAVAQSGTKEENDKKGGNIGLLSRLIHFIQGRDERDEELLELVNGRDDDDKQPLSPEEKALVAASLEFSNQTAEAVSVPRADMVAISNNTPFKQAIEIFAECQHSRLPVIGEDLDDIIGFITLKDLVQHVGHEKKFKLEENVRPCAFVPDNLSVFKVLEAMRRDRVQMAIVVDEYGGTNGLVTLKDIIEVLVGDMADEHETRSPQMFTPIGDNTYKLDPRLPIEALEEALGASFIIQDNNGHTLEREFETAGGLVLALARKMPATNETFTTGNGYSFTVTQTDGRRIQQLKLSYSPAQAQAEQHQASENAGEDAEH